MASPSDSVTEKKSTKNNSISVNSNHSDKTNENFTNYGLHLSDVYKLALNFYKEQGGKAVHFNYEDKLQLMAFAQQVAHGPFEANTKLPPLGLLDVVGNDRRLAWQKLKSLPKEQAQISFVELLNQRCSLFLTYVEAHRRKKDEEERMSEEDDKRKAIEMEKLSKQLEAEKLAQEEAMKQEAIKRQIQHALNEQTFEQFKKYAEEQFPDDSEKQGTLIRQLQEQHYIQYVHQIKIEQKQSTLANEESSAGDQSCTDDNEKTEETVEISDVEITDIEPANMWTRTDIFTFKQYVSSSEGDGVVRVAHGETITVRVPTHPHSNRVFWEFATDDYDIGFGVYFEYGVPLSDHVSVHVAESEDDDEDDESDGPDDTNLMRDLETGAISLNQTDKPILREIIPVYRRDSQIDVYAGCHQYSAQGCYLLKFDNSYSMWRSKTLYYRIYYSQ